jgi:anti-anti-sigma factor
MALPPGQSTANHYDQLARDAMRDADRFDPPTFRLTVTPDGERVVVAAQGELDLLTVPAVEREVRELRARGFTSIVLDLRELTFIDSTGLGLLLRLDAEAGDARLAFAIVEGDGPVRRVLRLSGLAGRFAQPDSS